MMEFIKFDKIPRLNRDCVITEKIDGTNAQIAIEEDGTLWAGSRNRWLSEGQDNFGFYAWAMENKEDLLGLGPGRHFGEWFGRGIQRGYQLKERAFVLFNRKKWNPENIPACCSVVPILYEGPFTTDSVIGAANDLRDTGSQMVKGYEDPEGLVIYHKAANRLFKVTLKGDDAPKTLTL